MNCAKSLISELMRLLRSMSKKKDSRRTKSRSPKAGDQPSQLLFINKDPQNLTRTAEETYAIGSHVSKGSRKWKKSRSYLDLDTSTNRILGGTDPDMDEATTTKPVSSSAAKGLKLRWRMFDGRVTSTRTVGAEDFAKPVAASASASAPASASKPTPKSTRSSDSSAPDTPAAKMPPTIQSSDEERTRRIHSLLQVYFQQIRPAVFSLSRSWIWIDDLSLVLSSPVLTYAICAFTSAFTVGSEYGLDKLCLPPEARVSSQVQETAADDTLWPMPEWFLFQAQAISLLRHQLALPSDPSRPVQKPELHAILFLMRLHVMLGNQDAANMHMSAINRATENAAILPDLRIDIAMWRVNFVLALSHPSAIRTRPYVPAISHTQQDPLLDVDLDEIPDVVEQGRVYRLLMDRSIIWKHTSPTQTTVPYASESLIQDHVTIDAQGYATFHSSNTQQIRICLLIARYLFAYLRYIDADTTLGCIRELVPELQSRLSSLLESPRTGVDVLWRHFPHVMTYLLFVGAFASRGAEDEKIWFTRRLCRGVEVSVFESFEDVTKTLGMFIGLETVREGLLVDVWRDVVREMSGDVEGSGG